MKDLTTLVARLLILAMFAYFAYENISDFNRILSDMQGREIPASKFLLIGGTCLLIVGCFLLALGYKTKIAARLFLLYFIPVMLYTCWAEPLQQWLEKLAIIGGLFLLIVHGSGKYSVKSIVSRMRS